MPSQLLSQPSGPTSILFCRSAAGFRSPTSLLIKILQSALAQANFYTFKIDGEYGPGTETAIKRFQAARGSTADGRCRESDWEDVTGLPPPSWFDRCLHLTAAFEGTGFEGAVGNFDGAGVTFGLIGMTLKSDLPSFLNLVEREYPGTLARAFGAKQHVLRRILTASPTDKEAWANSISTGANRYGLQAEWKDAFARFGALPEVQKLQLENARDHYWKTCVKDAKRWRAADALDVAMFYDTAVQMGGAGGRPGLAKALDAFMRDQPDLKGASRRRTWAQLIAQAANPRWQNDVLKRRLAIGEGEGTVHGERFNMADWGLGSFSVELVDLEAVDPTFMPASFGTVPGANTPVVVSASEGAAADLPPKPVAEPIPQPSAPEASSPQQPVLAPVVISSDNLDVKRDYKVVTAMALSHIARERIDREWGAFPLAALLERRSADLPSDWRTWPVQRQATTLVQLICKDKGSSPGEIDGYWGQLTGGAFDDLVYLRDHGRLPPNWRDGEDNNAGAPSNANPRGWPKESQAALTAFYGPHGDPGALVQVRCPWPLQIAWEPYTPVKTIRCHRKVADSLGTVLEAIHQRYGEAELKRLGLNLFGGSYNDRKIRGGDRWSTHAWGIAIDWDPDRNQLNWHQDKAGLARPEYNDWWAIWEREGWYSLGRKKDYDWMHVQAAWR
ncbi:peptidoglycan hydrolase-like protein with peptidoglycan-binding domain [Bradyrhizobium japonicum]